MTGAAVAQRSTDYSGPERRAVDVRIVKLEGRLDGHEDICAIRYKALEEQIREGKDAVSALNTLAIKIALGLLGTLATGFVALWWQINAAKHLIN